jgi:hypothetical protein
MRRLKLNLPFQVVGQQSRTATLLLATTMAALTKRPEESKQLNTLVLDHVSDTTLIDICNNPIDLGNTIQAFSGLKHLVLSIKRQEARDWRQIAFTKHLWFLIRREILPQGRIYMASQPMFGVCDLYHFTWMSLKAHLVSGS